MSRREFRRIRRLARPLLSRDHKRMLKRIKDVGERTEGLKYLVASLLKLKHEDLNHRSPEKKPLLLEAKLSQLEAKIRILEVSHSKGDYRRVFSLLKEIEVEVSKCLDS